MATTTANAKLRHNEYYGQQSTLDELYERSLKGAKFNKLYEKIVEENNILLAYRNIKANTGSKTEGTDGLTIKDIADMTNQQVITMVKRRLKHYTPQSCIFRTDSVRPIRSIPTDCSGPIQSHDSGAVQSVQPGAIQSGESGLIQSGYSGHIQTPH